MPLGYSNMNSMKRLAEWAHDNDVVFQVGEHFMINYENMFGTFLDTLEDLGYDMSPEPHRDLSAEEVAEVDFRVDQLLEIDTDEDMDYYDEEY